MDALNFSVKDDIAIKI